MKGCVLIKYDSPALCVLTQQQLKQQNENTILEKGNKKVFEENIK
jgi:hypothetical protein